MLKRFVTPLFLLIALSFLLKGIALFLGPEINPDGVRYIFAAREFQSGNSRLALTSDGEIPFYPILLAGTQFLIRDWVLAGQLISAFSLVLAVIPLYLLSRELFGSSAALWSGLAFVLSPELNTLATRVVRDPLFLFFLLWGVLLAFSSLRRWSVRRFSCSLLCIIPAILLRMEAILLLLVFVAVTLVAGWQEERFRGLRRRIAAIALPAIFLLPVILSFRQPIAEFFAGSHGIGAFTRNLLDANLFGTYSQVYASLKEWESTLPNAQWGLDIAEIVRHNLPAVYFLGFLESFVSTMYPLFFLLALAGLARSSVRERGGNFILSLCVVFLAAAYFSLLHRNFLSERYLLVPAVLLLPWTGGGVETLRRALRKNSWQRFAPVLTAVALAFPVLDTVGNWEGGGAGVKEAGRWLASKKEFASSLIICNDDRIPFYADRRQGEYGVLSNRDLGRMEQIALAQQGDLLAVRIPARNRAGLPLPVQFERIREFVDEKNSVLIFQRKE